jgi:hypothetical protein
MRIGNNWVEGNDCFINELEVLNQPLFVWSLASNRRIIEARTTN